MFASESRTSNYVAVAGLAAVAGFAAGTLFSRSLCGVCSREALDPLKVSAARLKASRHRNEHPDSVRLRCEVAAGRANEKSQALPLTAVNHLSLEASDADRLRRFYEKVLGFEVITRPDFPTKGYWLQYGDLGLHMAQFHADELASHGPLGGDRELWQERHRTERELRGWEGLPTGDHLAFVTDDLLRCEKILAAWQIPFKKVGPTPAGAIQLFFSDPEGNMIEVGDCAPSKGKKTCN